MSNNLGKIVQNSRYKNVSSELFRRLEFLNMPVRRVGASENLPP